MPTLKNAGPSHKPTVAECIASGHLVAMKPILHRTRKAIAYAYPTSPAADFYGHKDGCWYVSTSAQRQDGSWSPNHMLEQGEGFGQPDHPDLIALYRETDGEMCPYFKSHGNAKALAAIAIL